MDDFDAGSIEHHLEKIEANISIAGLLQNPILLLFVPEMVNFESVYYA